MVTGESMPVSKASRAKVIVGTLNQSSSFIMRAEKVGRDTLLAQIVQMMAAAQRSRAPIQRLADQVSSWFVPLVIVFALAAFAAWSIYGPEPRFAFGLVAAVSVRIIACPCALGLATPMLTALITLSRARGRSEQGVAVADLGFDGGVAAQLALDDTEHAALLAGDENAVRIGSIVTAISFVDIGALDGASGEPLGVGDGCSKSVTVIGIARQRFGVEHELATRRADIGGDDRNLDAKLIGRAGLALANAFDLGSVEGIQLPATLALLLGTDLAGADKGPGKDFFQGCLTGNLAADVADDAANVYVALRKRKSSVPDWGGIRAGN
jgi:E1-E2 ATPase